MQTSALTLLKDRSPAMGDAYLKFEISQGIQAVLPMRQVQEVLVLPPQRLTPMPNMPACILGLTNRRTHVLWVADLANLLEIGALDPSPQQYDLVIVRSHGVSVAIAVKQVDGIFWATPETLQPPPRTRCHQSDSLSAWLCVAGTRIHACARCRVDFTVSRLSRTLTPGSRSQPSGLPSHPLSSFLRKLCIVRDLPFSSLKKFVLWSIRLMQPKTPISRLAPHWVEQLCRLG